MSTVALHTRSAHQPGAVIAGLLAAFLIVVATFTFAITRDARGFDATPTSACDFRHHGWFC